MVRSIFATKIGMTQAWDSSGRRWAVTRCVVQPNMVLGHIKSKTSDQPSHYLIGYGAKKLKNTAKPLRSLIEKNGFSSGVRQLRGLPLLEKTEVVLTAGQTLPLSEILAVGAVVKVQGTSKGRGFAGAMKRHGFHGGPATHGQSDRARAVGSIGAGTTPGRVLPGKRMPGHYGVETHTVRGLVVLHVDPVANEVWLSGPVPGSMNGTVEIITTGETKSIELDKKASRLAEPVAAVEEAAEPTADTTEETSEATEPAAEAAPAVEAPVSEEASA